ncbi:MAG: hypothetical protein HZA50_19215 [Planctomycetes bacterium]|nr:hypothetical protein [Planctomycetota bacterium]
MDKKIGVKLMVLIGGAVLGFVFLQPSLAGVSGLPFRAELDRAKTVAIGKITTIVKEKENYEGKFVLGHATLKVSEVIKGQKADEIELSVVMKMDSKLPSAMASSPRVYHEGDEGIWLIMPDGSLSHTYGLLNKDRLQEVKSILNELDNRTWSQEVNGLKVWASTDKEFSGGKDSPGMVIFAVKNVSDKTIYLPRSGYKGIAVAVARDSSGKEFLLRGLGNQGAIEPPPVSRALEAGETCYFHPDTENFSFFQLPGDMPAGKYSIIIKLANSVEKGILIAAGKENPVMLWTGSIETPAVNVEIPEKPAASQPAATQTAPNSLLKK